MTAHNFNCIFWGGNPGNSSTSPFLLDSENSMRKCESIFTITILYFRLFLCFFCVSNYFVFQTTSTNIIKSIQLFSSYRRFNQTLLVLYIFRRWRLFMFLLRCTLFIFSWSEKPVPVDLTETTAVCSVILVTENLVVHVQVQCKPHNHLRSEARVRHFIRKPFGGACACKPKKSLHTRTHKRTSLVACVYGEQTNTNKKKDHRNPAHTASTRALFIQAGTARPNK